MYALTTTFHLPAATVACVRWYQSTVLRLGWGVPEASGASCAAGMVPVPAVASHAHTVPAEAPLVKNAARSTTTRLPVVPPVQVTVRSLALGMVIVPPSATGAVSVMGPGAVSVCAGKAGTVAPAAATVSVSPATNIGPVVL